MKVVRMAVAAAVMALLFASCKTQTCPGYGEAESNQTVEQNA